MKNSTKFLDDIMKNSIQRNIVIDVIDKPTFEDWWRFEEECLGEHFGMNRDDSEDWWDTWFISTRLDNFILLEISIKEGIYEVIYVTEVGKLESLPKPVDLIIHFSEIYSKYLLKPLPETLDETKHKDVYILSQEDLDEVLGVAEEREQPKEFNHEKAVQDLLELYNKDLKLIFEEGDREAQEEIDSLTSTIKDMEEIIKRYEHNLTFIWGILEEKIKESK